ncbi:response regulator [Oryzomonas rubra]|uniref:histidine kinase n=1 Tax=Oryzomonas rubra TaxID=2509454 RepID=A0A5A9XMB7_9BACT|nr:response regulator [Oryzomonas rubra]KAA0893378.1 hybrid sensor histidine kinase/response regulator [Oryzomonas rubra]
MTMTSPPSPDDLTILYVEDETTTREQVKRMLGLRGYRLIVAENGREGVELYQTHTPDIVLTDIMMPLMSGLDMAREIRSRTRDAQIIVMTAFNDIDYLLQAIDIGINQFVLKPVAFQKLYEAIERSIGVVTMQRQLRRQNEHIRLLSNALEQSPSMAIITDTTGAIEYVNRKFCEITGFDADEAIGRTPRILKSGETSPEVYQDLWSTILQGSEWHGSMRNRKKNGDLFWENVSISPLKAPDGSLLKFIKNGEDVTRQRKLEAESLRSRKMEAIGILAGGMAHDFNNLLQVILGYISLAKLHVNSPQTIVEMLETAEQTSLRAKELSLRLLAFSKGGDSFVHPAPLAPLVTSAIAAVLRGKPAITSEVTIAPDLHRVRMDDSQMEQTFSNLAVNAVEAMARGGTLRITGENVTIGEQDPLALPAGEYVHLAFHDTGTGIPPENLPRIFDPYFTTKEMGSQKGMGLSLALCHSIVRKHKGAITAESTPDTGATFHIYLPALADEPTTPHETASP